MSASESRHVTIRVKTELYQLYQIYLVKQEKTMKDDITAHVMRQIEDYKIPVCGAAEYSNLAYTKVNFVIDKDLYLKYKIVLITQSTTPTADIIRYMMSVV